MVPTLQTLIGSSPGTGNRRNVICDWARKGDAQSVSLGPAPGARTDGGPIAFAQSGELSSRVGPGVSAPPFRCCVVYLREHLARGRAGIAAEPEISGSKSTPPSFDITLVPPDTRLGREPWPLSPAKPNPAGPRKTLVLALLFAKEETCIYTCFSFEWY